MKREAQVRERFAAQSVMTTLAARIVAVKDGSCVVEAPVRSLVSDGSGRAHSALISAIGEAAALSAALSLDGADDTARMVEIKINLLPVTFGEAVRASAQVMARDGALVVVAAEVVVLDGDTAQPVARLQGTVLA